MCVVWYLVCHAPALSLGRLMCGAGYDESCQILSDTTGKATLTTLLGEEIEKKRSCALLGIQLYITGDPKIMK